MISTFPGRGTNWLAGQTRLAPRIVTGRIGTPASSAIRTAPPFILTIEPSGSPRPPSGKITITPESRSHVNERRIAAGSLACTLSGQAPNSLIALPTTGHENASFQARNLIGLLIGTASQKGSP